MKPSWRMAPLVLLAALAAHAGTAIAQSYPSRPIRVVVPFSAGGAGDISARLISSKMTTGLNQPVIVETRPGAGGNIGADAVAKAAPDGYTFLMNTSNLAIAPSIYRKLPFDVVKDFVPISKLWSTFLVLVTNSKVPATSVKELIALARSKPGGLNYGHAGIGSTLHLTMEFLKLSEGIDIVAVPYKGSSTVLPALMSGEVETAFTTPESVRSAIKAGKLRPLAVTSRTRSPVMPDVPTMVEAGVPDFVEIPGWYGLFAPSGTPRDIVELIQREVAKIFTMPDARDRLQAMGYELIGSTPKEFEASYKADIARIAKIVKDARIPQLD